MLSLNYTVLDFRKCMNKTKLQFDIAAVDLFGMCIA